VVEGASADEKRVGLLGTGFRVRELEAVCDVGCEGLLAFVVNDKVND
jgi:hypothetical protein